MPQHKAAKATSSTPAALGFSMPAEWERHAATWLIWPHNQIDWPDKVDTVRWVYGEIVRKVCRGEIVRILVNGNADEKLARGLLSRAGADLGRVEFILHPTNRGWTRDTGPTFVKRMGGMVRRVSHRPSKRAALKFSTKGETPGRAGETPTPLPGETAIVHFHFNAWAKHDDWQKDRRVPEIAASLLVKRLFNAECNGKDFVIEGGGIEVNGHGTLLTTEQCYLDPKVQVRNPGLGRREIEETLQRYLGVTNVFWLVAGPAGDDTHGHIDDICRFVNRQTVVQRDLPQGRQLPSAGRELGTHSGLEAGGWLAAGSGAAANASAALFRRQPSAGQLCEFLYHERGGARSNVQ